ncbi:MAG: ClpX C4-type zinc finger protein, partial [Myxococcaceae bacterium]
MSNDVREYLKAAQAAEMRGDTHQAVENLKKAAVLYRQEGKPARALQMLRQARRLDGHRQDVLDELARFEWIPEQPMARAATAGNGEEEDLALAPLDAMDTGFIVPEKRL